MLTTSFDLSFIREIKNAFMACSAAREMKRTEKTDDPLQEENGRQHVKHGEHRPMDGR